MIEIRGLAKSFGDLRVVDDASFVARNGEITGLIGPNGAGKTTMFRLICTVLRPERGTTLIDGIDSREDPLAARRRLGVLPDIRALYTRLTAREHLRYFGELHGISRGELNSRIAELVVTLRMEDFIDRRAKGFSRGQQMKVALARALVHRPHNIMLDEPTNGLDVATSRAVRDLLRRLRAEGRCILLTSHIMQEVAALADRIVILAGGTVVLQGTPAELRRATGLNELEEIFMAATQDPASSAPAASALAESGGADTRRRGITMSAMLIVFRKEMVDHLRDGRSILISMIYPLMGPLLLGLMFFFVGGSMRVNDTAPLVVPIVNAASAPDLVGFLESHGATMQHLPEGARSLVLRGRLPFVLEFPAASGTAPSSPLAVHLITNPSRFDSIVATGRIIELLNTYQHETVGGRLSAAGVSADILNVLDIQQENIGRAAGPAVILLTMIPPFLIFTLFTGGVHVALNSTSGERERGSFEPLLMNPVRRYEVLAGKLGATIVFTLMALASQVVAFWVMLHVVPQESLGLVAPPGILRLLAVVSVCLPIVFLAAGTQLLISAVTRSMKEAQTYLGLLPLVPGLAGMVLALAPVNAQPLLALIPTFGQTLLMGQIVRSEAVSGVFVAITAVATLTSVALLLMLGFRLYEREEILFPQ